MGSDLSGDSHNEFSEITESLVEQKVIERMGQISSELAHDLRSPLQTIQNAIYLIEKDPENKLLYSMVRQSLAQATEILDSFREYYKSHLIQRLEVDPVKIVELALSNLEVPDNVEIVKEMMEVEPVSLDPSKMALAIRNLLVNAVEAMPSGGELRLKLSQSPDELKIVISDTGTGIPPGIAEIIYTPFMSGEKQGRGLGVPTAKRIVESHGGELSFKTETGEGTVWTIWIPRDPVKL